MHLKLSAPASDPFPCDAIYFWGGGKAGSTTLAALLKHDYDSSGYDPSSEFIDSPKEICWAERIRMLQQRRGFGSEMDSLSKWRGMTHGHKCHSEKRFVLDACPRYNNKEQAKCIIEENPNAKFLMLIRNPVDRLVSNINDVRRGAAVDVNEVVKKLLERNVEGGGTSMRRDTDRMNKWQATISSDNQARRRLSEGDEEMNDSNARKIRYRNRKRDLLRERLIERRTVGWIRREKEDGGTLRRAALGQEGVGALHQKFDHMSRMSRNHWELSLYGKNLQNLLAVVPASQVLVVQTEALSRNPQETINNILSFIGANKSKKVKALHENQLQDRMSYKTISRELKLELETAFRADHLLLLQQLEGKTFPWSWVTDGSNAGAVDDWLTTTPVDDNRAVV